MRLEQYIVRIMGVENGATVVEDRFAMAQNDYEALGRVMMDIQRARPGMMIDLQGTTVEYSANNHRLGRLNWSTCNRTVKL